MTSNVSQKEKLSALEDWFDSNIACHWDPLPSDNSDNQPFCVDCPILTPSSQDIKLRDSATNVGDDFSQMTHGDMSRPFWLPPIDHSSKCNGRCQRAKVAGRDSDGNITFLTGNTMAPFHRPDCHLFQVGASITIQLLADCDFRPKTGGRLVMTFLGLSNQGH